MSRAAIGSDRDPISVDSHRIESYQIVGGPDWLDDYAYDVIAISGVKAMWSEMYQMLQSLLAERFHLAIRRESREIPAVRIRRSWRDSRDDSCCGKPHSD